MNAIRVLLLLCVAIGYRIAPAQELYAGTGAYVLAPRTALVIGVPSVTRGVGFTPLKNPRNDAIAVTKALRELGFTVFAPHENYSDEQLTRQAIKRMIYDFAIALRASSQGVGVVYFSGHGIQADAQKTFIVPYDGFVQFGRDLNEELLPVGLIYDAFNYAGNVLNVLVLDACRDFPYARMSDFGTGSSFVTEEPESPSVFRANATLSGAKAADGSSDLSPYAGALVDALKQPDLSLSDLFKSVASRLSAAGVNQIPTATQVGSRDFIFRPTRVSFNREQQIFSAGGPRSMYEHLYQQFAGGYFGRAAQEYANSAPLPPPATVDVSTVVPQRLSNTPAPASNTSPVVPGGVLLQVLGETVNAGGTVWVPVAGPGGQQGYVDRAKTEPAPPPTTAKVPLAFESGQTPGTEKLSLDSVSALRSAAPDRTGGRVAARIIGYRQVVEGTTLQPDQQMLVRQAAAVGALKSLGIDARNITSEVLPAGPSSAANKIEVLVTRPQ